MVMDSPAEVSSPGGDKGARGILYNHIYRIGPHRPVPSLAVSVRVNVVSEVTSGAVNVVEAEEALAKAIPEPDGADHLYDVTAPPSGIGSRCRTGLPCHAFPDRLVTCPAFTVGGALALSLSRCRSPARASCCRSQRRFEPEAVTLTWYRRTLSGCRPSCSG